MCVYVCVCIYIYIYIYIYIKCYCLPFIFFPMSSYSPGFLRSFFSLVSSIGVVGGEGEGNGEMTEDRGGAGGVDILQLI